MPGKKEHRQVARFLKMRGGHFAYPAPPERRNASLAGTGFLSPAPSKTPGKHKSKAAKRSTSIQSHKDLPVDPPVIHDTCQNAHDLAAVVAAWPDS